MTTAGEAVPIVSKLIKGGKALRKVRDKVEEARLLRLGQKIKERASSEKTAESLARYQAEKPDRLFVIINRYLDDDEKEKDWAYAQLLVAMAEGLIPQDEDIRFIRSVRDLTNRQLQAMVEIGHALKKAGEGKYGRFSSVVNRAYHDHAPTIRALVRWNFWNPDKGGDAGYPADDFGLLYEVLTGSEFPF